MFDLGARIAALRRVWSLTQDELAERTGVHRGTVHRWETGRVVPQPSAIRDMAAVFRVPIGILTDPGVSIEDLERLARAGGLATVSTEPLEIEYDEKSGYRITDQPPATPPRPTPDTPIRVVPERLARLRGLQHMTWGMLAEKAGVAHQTVKDLDSNKLPDDPADLARIVRALGMPEEMLHRPEVLYGELLELARMPIGPGRDIPLIDPARITGPLAEVHRTRDRSGTMPFRTKDPEAFCTTLVGTELAHPDGFPPAGAVILVEPGELLLHADLVFIGPGIEASGPGPAVRIYERREVAPRLRKVHPGQKEIPFAEDLELALIREVSVEPRKVRLSRE